MKMNRAENPFKYSIGTRVRDILFLDALKPQKSDKILDVGCGLGYFTNMLSIRKAHCIGIDIDEICIQYCKRHMKGQYFRVDLTETPYPFPDNYFDKILCSEVLEHIKDNEVVLGETRRILKPNGILLVTTPCTEGIFGTFWKRIGHNNVENNSCEYHHHKGYSQKSLTELLAKHNFIKNEAQYTMVLGVEAFMGLTKIVIRMLQLKKINSQANALNINNMLLWKIYKRLFPLLMLLAKLEQPLARVLKGHMIIIKGTLNK